MPVSSKLVHSLLSGNIYNSSLLFRSLPQKALQYQFLDQFPLGSLKMSSALSPPMLKLEVDKDDLEIDQLQDDDDDEITDEEVEEEEHSLKIHAKSVTPAKIRVQTTEELNGKIFRSCHEVLFVQTSHHCSCHS